RGSPSSFLSPALYRRHVVALGGPYGHHNPSDHRHHTVASRWRLVRPRPVVLGSHSTYISVMLQRVPSSRGRPLNAPAAFIHPCQPKVRLSSYGLTSRAVRIALKRRRSDRTFPSVYHRSD